MTERLEERLVARGLLTPERAEDALRSQALVGGAMDTLLLEMGAVREQDLVTALGEVSGLQPIYLADYVPNPAMAAALPREDAERLNLAPLSVEDGMLHVAVPYPVPMRGLEALVRKLGRSVAPWVSTDVRVPRLAPRGDCCPTRRCRPVTPRCSGRWGPRSRSGWPPRWRSRRPGRSPGSRSPW